MSRSEDGYRMPGEKLQQREGRKCPQLRVKGVRAKRYSWRMWGKAQDGRLIPDFHPICYLCGYAAKAVFGEVKPRHRTPTPQEALLDLAGDLRNQTKSGGRFWFMECSWWRSFESQTTAYIVGTHAKPGRSYFTREPGLSILYIRPRFFIFSTKVVLLSDNMAAARFLLPLVRSRAWSIKLFSNCSTTL